MEDHESTSLNYLKLLLQPLTIGAFLQAFKFTFPLFYLSSPPAEIPCQQHGQNMHDSEASRPFTDPDNDERPFSNTQDSSVQPLIDRSETLQLGTECRCFIQWVSKI